MNDDSIDFNIDPFDLAKMLADSIAACPGVSRYYVNIAGEWMPAVYPRYLVAMKAGLKVARVDPPDFTMEGVTE